MEEVIFSLSKAECFDDSDCKFWRVSIACELHTDVPIPTTTYLYQKSFPFTEEGRQQALEHLNSFEDQNCAAGTVDPSQGFCCEGKCKEDCPCNWKLCKAFGLEWCAPEEFPCTGFTCSGDGAEFPFECISVPVIFISSNLFLDQQSCNANCPPPPTGQCRTIQRLGGTECECEGQCCRAGQTCSKDPDRETDQRCIDDPSQPQCQCSCRASYMSSRLIQDFAWKGSSPP